MSQDETDQTCPFCEAKWGQCSHFFILTEWEGEAMKSDDGKRIREATESADNSAGTAAHVPKAVKR